MMPGEQKSRYCVIGAGAAGMAATKTLREEGFEVDCLEKTAYVGGHWRTDYDSLHLITPRDSSGFEDFPLPGHLPLYPSRDQVYAYLNDYAARFNLKDTIEFDTIVHALQAKDKNGEQGWFVTLQSGETREYNGVVIANGHLWAPSIPEMAENFTGKSLHSCRYKNTGDIAGKSVLVVGFGNSGCDIAADGAQFRYDVSICIRRGQVFQPKTLFGKPRSELPFLQGLPAELQNMMINAYIMTSIGPACEYPGLPEPETYDLEKQPPVVNTLLPYWIQHGRITVVPGIKDIDRRNVIFTDGSKKAFDTIVWATGFKVSFPFLKNEYLKWQDQVPIKTAGSILPTTVESLYFVGLTAPRGPQWPVYSAQSRLIANMLRLKEKGITNLAARFRKIGTHNNRIDIVRRLWLNDMIDTQEKLDAIDITNRKASGENQEITTLLGLR